MNRPLAATLVGLALGGLLAAAGRPAAPAAAEAEKLLTNSIGMQLALIPAGTFTMGSPADEPERDADEARHEVRITRPFYLGTHEVTQEQFEKVMPRNQSHFNAKNGGSPLHPVEQVLWKEAVEFCKRLSGRDEEQKAGRVYRLPTEAEWEYACRAGTTTAFHGGKALTSRQANIDGRLPYGGADKGPFLGKTAKVGSYPANAWGLHDMHGNVAEWCQDWYDSDYYAGSPKDDPPGPARGVLPTGFDDYFLVVRGGSWLDDARGCRSAYRFRYQPSERYRLVGFRVACGADAKGP